jgi:glutaconyl-CoA/methylmalonyl-CoA decarboxylase subunit gamma
MKYTVKIADTSYEVEIENIHARPVIARVDGERVEVHPEDEKKTEASKEPKEFKADEMPQPSATLSTTTNALTAPLPGTIVEIFVKNGEEIESGHVVLIIEAMKMKNSIRSTRSGRIAEILVSVGQSVAHKQPLVRFE